MQKEIDLLDEIKNIVVSLDAIDDYIDELPNKLSNCDSQRSDLEHFIENNKMNATQCCSVVKELHRVLTVRRKVKQDMEIGSLLKREILKLNNKSNRQMLISNICKRKKHLDTTYKNRKYTKEQLIALGIEKNK